MGYKYFVDRETELSKLISLVGSEAKLLYLYGVRGVGITTLLRRFGESLKSFNDYIVIYIDSIEGDRIEYALTATEGIREYLQRIIIASDMPPGRALLYSLPIVLVRLGLPNIRDRHLVVLIDHLDRGIGPGKVPSYLDSLANTAHKLLSWKARSVTIISAGTQLGLSSILASGLKQVDLMRVTGLPLRAYEEFVKRLGLSIDPGGLWRLTGGNPGETIIIATRYKGDVGFWKRALAARLRKVVKAVERRGLRDELTRLLQGDAASEELMELLQAYDIVIRADTPVLGGREDTSTKWVWSLPVYREILYDITLGKGVSL